MGNLATIESYEDCCPVHGGPVKREYTYGSDYSARTDVCVFEGCRCAVAVAHDPIGVLPASYTYCTDFDSAAGIGRLRAASAAAKYR